MPKCATKFAPVYPLGRATRISDSNTDKCFFQPNTAITGTQALQAATKHQT